MNRHNKLRGERSNDKYIIAGVATVLIIVGLVAVWISTVNKPLSQGNNATSTTSTSTTVGATSTVVVPKPGDSKIMALAKCLAKNQITIYGAEWCSHCQDQKKAFGEAWQYVPYVECPQNTKLCLSKQVTSYPTWLKTDGTKLDGFIELDKLAKWANCPF